MTSEDRKVMREHTEALKAQTAALEAHTLQLKNFNELMPQLGVRLKRSEALLEEKRKAKKDADASRKRVSKYFEQIAEIEKRRAS